MPHRYMVLFVVAALLTVIPADLFAADRDRFVWVESWRHVTSQPVRHSAANWNDQTGVSVLATVFQDHVTVYTLQPDGPKILAVLEELPQRPTAVGVTVPTDAYSDIWIGTESPGIVYIFRVFFAGGDVELIDRIRFAWSDIVEIIPFDLDGWGQPDVAVRTSNDHLMIFRWTPGGYSEVSIDPSISRDVTAIQLLNGRGEHNGQFLAIARGGDHILLLHWELADKAKRLREEIHEFERRMRLWAESPAETIPGAIIASQPTGDAGEGRLVQVWENYVWGSHSRMFVGSFSGLRDQIAVLSSQNLLYIYEWNADNEKVQSVGSPHVWSQPLSQLIGSGNITLQRGDQLIQKVESGIDAWQLSPSPRRVFTLNTSLESTDALYFTPDNTMIAVGERGFAFLMARSADQIRVLLNGREMPLEHPVIFQDDTIYLSSTDWRQLVGITLRWNEKRGEVIGFWGLRFILGRDNESRWLFNGRAIRMGHEPLVEKGLLYLPLSFGQAVGAKIEWEPYSYTLLIGR